MGVSLAKLCVGGRMLDDGAAGEDGILIKRVRKVRFL